MAGDATVARNDDPGWHDATVAPRATVAHAASVARYAMVKGELRVPNTLNFSVFPTLDLFAKAPLENKPVDVYIATARQKHGETSL